MKPVNTPIWRISNSIFLSHHVKEFDDCEVELDGKVCDIFYSVDDAIELTQDERKEVLKLHKYFAHRNAKKLWDNLFRPAGRLKGKKKLVMELLDKCEVCRKYDFSKDIDQWEEEQAVDDEDIEPCCSLFHSKVLTKAQATKRTGHLKHSEE